MGVERDDGTHAASARAPIFEFDAYSKSTYYLVATCLSVCLLGALAITRTKAGLIFQAIRDQEERVRFFGYDVAAYKIMALSISAAIAIC